MFEKVNPQHPDKVADRIAGAIVDLAYAGAGGFSVANPKIAVEVLLGHGNCTCIIETSLCRKELSELDVRKMIYRIAGDTLYANIVIVEQDKHLAENQQSRPRCGDNGIFCGCPMTPEQKALTAFAKSLYEDFPSDGKFILDSKDCLVVCQSKATEQEIRNGDYVLVGEVGRTIINPLGEWTGGINVDSGATNRKLGSDMGDAVTGGGLHGKDLSKADVSVNIACHILAQKAGMKVQARCAIGDEDVTFRYEDGRCDTLAYEDTVEMARLYILTQCDGSFAKFAEWGLIR